MSEQSDATLLRTFLAGRNHPCPVCGYDLCDLQSDRCPECGKTLRLTITQDRPTWAPFVIGLIAFAAPLGAAICAISGVLYWRFTRFSDWDGLLLPLIANGVTLVLAVAALLLWLRFAPRLRRQSRSRQWAWALFACTLTLIGHVIFLVIVW